MIGTPTLVLLDPGADLQAAIDATPAYGTLRLGAGGWDLPSATPLTITRPITIEGAGKPYQYENLAGVSTPDTYVGWTTGTVIRPYKSAATSNGGKDSSVFKIVGPVTNVVIKNLGIEHPYTQPTSKPVTAGTGYGIWFDATTDYIGYCRVENVCIRFMGGNGIYMQGSYAHDSSVIDKLQLIDVDVVSCRLQGLRIYRAYDTLVDECSFVGSEQCGIYAESSFNLRFIHPLFNNNGQSFARTGTNWKGDAIAWPYYDQAQFYLNGVNGFTIDRADLEQWTGAGHDTGGTWTSSRVPHAIATYGSNTGSISGLRTFNPGYGDDGVDSTLVFLGTNTKDVKFWSNQSGDLTYSLYTMDNAGVQGIQYEPFNIIDHGWGAIANIHVSTGLDTDANPSGGNLGIAALGASDKATLRSYIAGLTLPRVSAASAISTDLVDGTIVYDNSVGSPRFYNGTGWANVLAGPVFYNDELVTVDDEAVTY